MDLQTQNPTSSPPPAPHAIVFPYPLQGHVIPAVHLAIKLASSGFTITFINTDYIHHEISRSSSSSNSSSTSDIFSDARESGLDIRYRTVTDGFPLRFDRSGNHDQFMEGILHVFPAHADEVVGELVNEYSSEGKQLIKVLIADTFFVWPAEVAHKYGLIHASFWTEPALVLSLYYHMDLLILHGHFGQTEKKNRKDSINYIPGIKSINPKDLQSYLQPTCTDTNSICHRIINRAFPSAKHAHFSIINTIHSLESDTITPLQQIQPTYTIGPIFPAASFTQTPPVAAVTTSLWTESDCSNWLNSQPDRSVLYISFGSYAHTTKSVIHQVARGLLLSGVRFIWVVRPDIVSSDDPNPLPDGFEETVRAANTGMVVTWCSQNKVLSHRAVGGFLTHCGWNSILESVWCGVPLLCYPLYTDQFVNRKLVVDDWGAGIDLCDDGDDDEVGAEEVARKIECLMNGGESGGGGVRMRVEEMRKIMQTAVGKGGSSELEFNKLVQDLKTKVQETLSAQNGL